MRRVFKGSAAAAVAAVTAFTLSSGSALAYQSGTIGYDVSFPQCTTPTASTSGPLPTSSSTPRGSIPPPVPTSSARSRSVPTVVQSRATGRTRVAPSVVSGFSRTFGIVGVNGGKPFNYNPCLADEYHHTPNPAFYVNTGYATIYTDANHTLPDCTSKSAFVSGRADQQAAWAVGCSEAEKDLANVSSQALTNWGAWWLDVEPANSWCSSTGPDCTDLTLNQFAIQGLIDAFRATGAAVGIYSNKSMWSTIVGANAVHGQSADWYATGTTAATAAKPYCVPSNTFSGAPVRLAQFVNSFDYDYAC